MKEPRKQLGQEAELLAEEFLRGRGLEIIEKNVFFKFGEIDLVARDGDTIVFVEVRSRTRPDIHPAATITRTKQQHIVRAAEAYLQRHRLTDIMARFDVVTVCTSSGQIEYFPNAFEAGR